MSGEIIGQVRTAIAVSLQGLSLEAYEYSPASPPTEWSAYIAPRPFDYHSDFDDGADLQLLVRFYVPTYDEQSAQQLLDQWISPEGTNSAIAAIEADSSLGGVVDSVEVRALTNYGPVAFVDGTVCQAAEISVSVYL